jgi:hypothetical protein
MAFARPSLAWMKNQFWEPLPNISKFQKTRWNETFTAKQKPRLLHSISPGWYREVGGPADIVYILGYKSKKLVQVNIDWSAGVTKNFDPRDVVNAGNLLRNHFGKRRYKKDGFFINANLKNGTIVLYRGKDKKDRMVLLRLKNPKTKESEDKKDAGKNLTLKLSYIFEPKNPDMFKAKTK